MVTTITYPSSNVNIRGNDLSPIVVNGVLLDLNPSSSTPSLEPHALIGALDALRSNSQGTLSFEIVYGSLTSVSLRILFYRGNNFYRQTASTFQGGDQVLKPMALVLNSLDLPAGFYQYEFPIPPCDGIKIDVVSISGTNTGSSLRNIYLSLRTN